MIQYSRVLYPFPYLPLWWSPAIIRGKYDDILSPSTHRITVLGSWKKKEDNKFLFLKKVRIILSIKILYRHIRAYIEDSVRKSKFYVILSCILLNPYVHSGMPFPPDHLQ